MGRALVIICATIGSSHRHLTPNAGTVPGPAVGHDGIPYLRRGNERIGPVPQTFPRIGEDQPERLRRAKERNW